MDIPEVLGLLDDEHELVEIVDVVVVAVAVVVLPAIALVVEISRASGHTQV